MRINLAGEWSLCMEQDVYEDGPPERACGKLVLPGSLQAAGYGYPIHGGTEWVSSLHNPFWYEREEYSYRPEGTEDIYRVPFLAQPARHFVGKAWYEREFFVPGIVQKSGEKADLEAAFPETAAGMPGDISGDEGWTLYIERTAWRSEVYIDDVFVGGDCSLCAAHEIFCGCLAEGSHRLRICIDNSMQYPYRPDGHGVSDALGATWNGMAGEIALLSQDEMRNREREKKEYARKYPRSAEVREGKFIIDGRPEYFRGTHFGGDYPLTGYPAMERGWWDHLMEVVKSWGLNFIRFHSYCPPEAAFLAADEAGVYLQPECGMWNVFHPGEEEMIWVLREETRRILRQFGHHPSFVLFSPTNEPGGDWYEPLKSWVRFARETDEGLGYGGRRLYTAQSGWFYDVPPGELTREDTDYLYFHRSAYGPVFGGNIRGFAGWKGKDYNPSLEGAGLPAICHELGQWCSYPDFDRIIPKFTGFMRPGNFELFRENARARGVLPYAADFAYCSGRNQLRLYKEDIEANLRTDHLYGFELLDLHDYLGQGTALVGLLDAFWEEKGAVRREEFLEFCGETVPLVRLPAYVYRSSDILTVPVELCHFGREELEDVRISWRLRDTAREKVYGAGSFYCKSVACGGNAQVGVISVKLENVCSGAAGMDANDGISGENVHCVLEAGVSARNLTGAAHNHWDVYVYDVGTQVFAQAGGVSDILDTHDFAQAKRALEAGQTVIFRPWMSDLDYDCPPVSIRNSFWNDQMGPGWGRGVGLSVQNTHPIFKSFPTEHDGGWQWEEILDYARGFGLKSYPEHIPLVRVIDEWNRNLPMGILLEADVLKGRLLLVSADLETDADRRPAAQALNQAIIRYAGSGKYIKAQSLPVEAIESRLFPLYDSGERIEKIGFYGEGECGCVRRRQTTEGQIAKEQTVTGWSAEGQAMNRHTTESQAAGEQTMQEQATQRLKVYNYNPQALTDVNLNTTAVLEAQHFPVEIVLQLKEPTYVSGIYYAPPQKDRMFEGCIRDYEVECLTETGWRKIVTGVFENSLFAQKAFFAEEFIQEKSRSLAIKLRVMSCYGQGERSIWEEGHDGWHRARQAAPPRVQLAALHLIFKGEEEFAEESQYKGVSKYGGDSRYNNERFWRKNVRSATKEIENV